MPISFPGLFGDWEFNPDPVAIHVGNGIYWYGIILAAAMLAGMFLCMKQAIEMANIYSGILNSTMDTFSSILSNNLND